MRTELRAAEVPPSLLECAPPPQVPPQGATQRVVASYVVQMKANRDACELKVNRIGKILKDQRQSVKDFNSSQSGEGSQTTPVS